MDKRLEYRCWGAPPTNGRAIVLLHEGLGCVALWRDFPDNLHTATGMPVMAYSRAGYGQSDPDDLPRPLDWMTTEAIMVLPEVLEACRISRPFLVGHSDGATIAAIYAGFQPEAEAAVLIAPHFFTEERGLLEIARTDAQFRGEADMAKRMGKYHRDPQATFSGWADAWLDPDFRQWHVEAALEGIECPVLAIQGRQDQYGTLAQIDAVSRNVDHAKVLIVEECQHTPHLEHPDAVIAAISQFVH
ncbi:alpha/beta hydrolase [Gymnodinialimonas sp. 2305UL16-5]|uniref:alpha/beta fold hydrolase n=1 Tax=Gymnodinialimonas mytili TaxID=3126503 RepID=UPI0030B12468